MKLRRIGPLGFEPPPEHLGELWTMPGDCGWLNWTVSSPLCWLLHMAYSHCGINGPPGSPKQAGVRLPLI